MKVCVYTLGCRLNQAESEAIIDSFVKEGFEAVKENADLYIVNTCTVTAKAEAKARRMIRLFLKDNVPVVVTGCYAEMNADTIQALGEDILVLSLIQKASLMNLASHILTTMNQGYDMKYAISVFKAKDASKFDYQSASGVFHSRAYLKIQDGCDNACDFCRVHVARGKAVYLPEDEVIERAVALEAKGFNEIVLTGVNLTMYNRETGTLGTMLLKLLPHLKPSTRIRLSSLEADNIDYALIEAIKDERMLPYFHIPIQTCSQKILTRVNRRSSMEMVSALVNEIKKAKDDPFFACDLIAGLPSETDEDAEYTKAIIRELGFALIHVFPFSPRPNTALAKPEDAVHDQTKDDRAKELRDLSEELHSEYVARQIGRELEVLIEMRKHGSWYGTTSNYLKVKIISDKILNKGGIYKGILIKEGEFQV